MLLGDFKALSFDCYGTLIDWESGMIAALSGLTSRAGTSLTRDEILQAHARHESRQQAQTPTKPYRDLLPTVHKRLESENHREGKGCVSNCKSRWSHDHDEKNTNNQQT